MRLGMGGWSLVALGALLALAACAPAGTAGADDDAGARTSLAGTRWRLEELDGRPANAAASAVPTLAFGADGGSASGTTGCNQFNGPYTYSGTTLRFGALVTTRRACVDPAGNERETAFLRALEATTRYSLSDGALVLYAGGRAVARFRGIGG